MSLQFQNSMERYATAAATLWRGWRPKSSPQCMQAVERAIIPLVSFMPRLSLNWYNTPRIHDFGYHMPGNWSVNLNSYHSTLNLPFGHFIEWVTTPYHECRHAEQTYRIAQGVLAGDMELPGRDMHQQFRAYQPRGVQQIRQAFETGRPLDMNSGQRKQVLRGWLGIPAEVVDHADSHRSYFSNYLGSTSGHLTWYDHHANPVKDAVVDWMKAGYHGELSTINRRAQAMAGKAGGFGRMYMSLAVEKDAYGLEKQLQRLILAKLGKSLPANANETPP
jgi:hypothetical protein